MISEYFRNPTSTCDYPLLTINTGRQRDSPIAAEAGKPFIRMFGSKNKTIPYLLLRCFFPHLRTNTCGSLDAAETLNDPFQYCACNAEEQSLSYNFITSPSTSYLRWWIFNDSWGGETGSTASANSNRMQQQTQLEYGAGGRDRWYVKNKKDAYDLAS